MQFSLTEEQALLRDSVRRFVANEHDFLEARRLAESEEGFSRAHWATFAETGWLALAVSEDRGGIGGSTVDAALILEEFGRGLVGAPYLSTAMLCAGLMDACPGFEARDETLEAVLSGRMLLSLAAEETRSRYDLDRIETTARPAAGGVVLNGRKIVVFDGASADGFIVTARPSGSKDRSSGVGLYLVPAQARGVEVRRYRTIDGRGAADLDLDNVELPKSAVVADPEIGLALLEEAVDRSRLLMAAEALGAMDTALAMTVDYLKVRRQFGTPLVEFQSLRHRVADMHVKLENARSMLLRGLSMLDADASSRAAAVSATAIAVSQAGEFVGGQAIQLHGGIGMTEEHSIGHYYKRLRAIGKSYGDVGWHMRRYARLLADA